MYKNIPSVGSVAIKSPRVIWCIQSRSYGIVVVVVIVVAITAIELAEVKEEILWCLLSDIFLTGSQDKEE